MRISSTWDSSLPLNNFYFPFLDQHEVFGVNLVPGIGTEFLFQLSRHLEFFNPGLDNDMD